MSECERASIGRCALVWCAGTAVLLSTAWLLDDLLASDLAGVATTFRHGPEAGLPFDALLAQIASVVLSGSLLWLWVAGTGVVLEAAWASRRPTPITVVPTPAVFRRCVLAACGVGLAAGAWPAAAAGASAGPDPEGSPGSVSVSATASQPSAPGADDPRRPLAGLPLPDRAESPDRSRPPRITDARPPATPREVPRAAPQGSPEGAPGGTVVIRPGQTLWSLAAARLPSDATPAEISLAWQRIHAANSAVIGSNPHLIHPGTQLRVPPDLATNREEQP